MKTFIQKLLLTISFTVLVSVVNGQSRLLKMLEQQRYAKIVRMNDEKTVACKKDYINQRALAYSYSQMEVTDKAYDAYYELFSKYPNKVDAVDQLYFALAARKLELYGLSDSLILGLKDSAMAGQPLFEELTYAFFDQNKEKRSDYWSEFNFESSYSIKPFKQNTQQGEYAILKGLNGECFFTRHAPEDGLWKIRSATHNRSHHVVYSARYSDSSFILETVEPFNKSRASQHISYVDQDTRWVFLSRNVKSANKNHERVLNVFLLTKDTNTKLWTEIPFHLNTDKYSISDLVVSPDKTKVVFTSDMPGGYGKSDLYEAPIISFDKKGIRVGEPVNMGPQINTTLRDNFPRFSDSGDFYFSSEGHLGFGGMDVYTVDRNSGLIINMGKPVNSARDDFAAEFHEKWGTVSSNRGNDGYNDDLYFFRWTGELNTPEPTNEEILVKVIDDATGESVGDVLVTLSDSDDPNNTYRKVTDSTGVATLDSIPLNLDLELTAQPCGYKYTSTTEFTVNELGQRVFTISAVKYVEGEDLGVLFEVEPIYYELNSYALTSESKKELNKVSKVLIENPALIVELGSHTDSRGSDEFNLTLSNNRAKSVYNYLIEKGVSSNRLSYKGFGESKLINKCFDGIECSEEEHSANRRTEYLITGIVPCGSEDVVKAIVSNDPKFAMQTTDLSQSNMKIGDADGDGTPDYLDSDSDNDGIPDATEGRKDTDKDGLPNFIDKDSDNDGIPDLAEKGVDFDKDGKPNFLDTDSDNDGISDNEEGVIDADKDGQPNFLDKDSDNDGISDKLEGNRDSDGDGIMNYLDTDSDNDGIPDADEGTKDSDRDGKPNYRDTDSDNDNIPDKVEGTKDSDNDGKPDYLDTDSDEDGIPDKYEAPANYENYPKNVEPIKVNKPVSEGNKATATVDESGESNSDEQSMDEKLPVTQMDEEIFNEPVVPEVSKIVYRVQFQMANRKINTANFEARGLKNVFEYRSGKYYKYCAGEFENYNEAEAYKNDVISKGYNDAFVVKFQGTQRVN